VPRVRHAKSCYALACAYGFLTAIAPKNLMAAEQDITLTLLERCSIRRAAVPRVRDRRERAAPRDSALNPNAMRCLVAHCSACEQSEHANLGSVQIQSISIKPVRL
jgi:hypothetical protein